MAAVPMAGTVAPGAVAAIKLNYDISQNEFQGINTADVLLTTTARPLAKARPASVHSLMPGAGLLHRECL